MKRETLFWGWTRRMTNDDRSRNSLMAPRETSRSWARVRGLIAPHLEQMYFYLIRFNWKQTTTIIDDWVMTSSECQDQTSKQKWFVNKDFLWNEIYFSGKQVSQMGFHNRLYKNLVSSQLGVTFVSDRSKNVARNGVSLTELSGYF